MLNCMQICNVHVAVVVVVAKSPTKTNQVGEINSNFNQIIPIQALLFCSVRQRCVKVRATLEARLFFPWFQLIRSLLSGAVIAFAVKVKLF